MARASAGRSAVSRVLAVLDAFTVEAPYLTLSELAARAGLPVSSVHRLAAELVTHGLLERMPDRTYRLGDHAWELGALTPGALGLREVAAPFLQWVHGQVRQHVQLLVRSDLDVLVVDRVSTRDAVANGTIVGGRLPMQRSSSGIVMLASLGPEVLEQVLRRGLDPLTPGAPRTAEQLRTAVAHARRHGYADCPGWVQEGSRGIAVPVTGTEQRVVAALGVVVPNDGAPAAGFVAVLRRAASGIGEELLRSTLPAEHPRAGRGGAYRRLVHSSDLSMAYLEQRT